jgi:hypothetical protein
MNVDVIEYLGKYEEGVIVSLSIEMGGEYYNANFFYKEDILALSVDESMEEKLGCSIEDWEGYDALMLYIMKKVVPYDEIVGRLDDFDPGVYDIYKDDPNNQ